MDMNINLRYGDNRPKFFRRFWFAVLILLSVLLQNADGGFLTVFGAHVFLVIPLVICISMFEREVSSAFFGAFAGMLWDVSAGRDGFCTLLLMLLCAVCSMITNHFLRNNLFSALMLGGLSVLIFELCYLCVFLIFPAGAGTARTLLTFYLPSFLFTFLFIPIFYYPVKSIYTSHKTVDD